MTRAASLCVLLLAGACSTPASRIRRHQALFDTYPPEVQRKIRDGGVEVGFTADQALIALGAPDRKYRRDEPSGTEDIWVYGDHGARAGVGIGTVFGGGGAVYGAGLSLGTGPAPEARLRLVFKDGKVSAVERREK